MGFSRRPADRRGVRGPRGSGLAALMAALAWAAAVPAVATAQDKPNYFAAWVAVAEPAGKETRIAEGRWAPVVRFRPETVFVLDSPAVDAAKGNTLLAAGTRMVGMAGRPGLACELERPRGGYLIGCVEDKDGDGRFETFFDLNHANPFLFSAFRQPRSKDRAIGPLSLSPASASTAPAGGEPVSMVLFYRNRAELTGVSRFELCVLQPDNRNIWGDKAVGRGCLPAISIGDHDFPRAVPIYGRTLTFLSRDADGVTIAVTGADADLPARL